VNAIETKEAAFMGRITAGVTHEMKNVLAIIKESAGLMEDLLALSKDTSFPHREKFSSVLSKIRNQVARGVDISTRLNTFAHSPDRRLTEVDLTDLATGLALLAERFVRVKRVVLKVVGEDRRVRIVTDPLKMQMLFFECIELILGAVGQGSTITLRLAEDGHKLVSVVFSLEETGQTAQGPGPDLLALPRWPELEEIARDMKARIEINEPPRLLTLVFNRTAGPAAAQDDGG